MEQYEIIAFDKKIKERFIEAVSEKDYNREITFAIQALRGNDALQKCDPESIRNALVNIALTGATLNPVLQQAFLIPRKIKGTLCCCLDFSYRGLTHIAVDSGGVIAIEARAVFDGEHFYYEYGLNPRLEHIPILSDEKDEQGKEKSKPRVKASYAIGTLPSGHKQFVVLDREKIERARKTSMAPNSPMWRDHFDEGAIKTAIKLLYKQLPATNRMSQAIHVLNQHEGLDMTDKDKDKAKDLEERFGFTRKGKEEDEKDKDKTVEGEIVLTCPIDDTVAAIGTCDKCDEKGSCVIYAEIKKGGST